MGGNEFTTMIKDYPAIIGGIAFLVLLMTYFIVRNNQKKKLRKELDDLNVRYTSIKTIPLPFKLNKAVALSRVNEDIATVVQNCKGTFDSTQVNIKRLQYMISDSEDLTETGKLGAAKSNNREIRELLDEAEQQVSLLNQTFDKILQQEVEQREQINLLKDEFRSLRSSLNENSTNYVYSYEALERKMLEIEKMFSTFEEWMFASEFAKANEVKSEIRQRLTDLENTLTILPDLLMTARGVIPRMMEEVNANYSGARHKGVYLRHLEIIKNVEMVSESLKGDLHSLKFAEPEGVEEHLEDCKKRLVQLLQQIEKENKSFDEVAQMQNTVKNDCTHLENMLTNVTDVYAKASMRFGFEDMEEGIIALKTQFSGFKQKAVTIGESAQANNQPYSSILLSLRELKQALDIFFTEVRGVQEKLNGACQDENHAKAQLRKLHLIMNEMECKVRKNRLPFISPSYEEDLKAAEKHIVVLEDLLKEIPLNIKKLNASLSEAIDFIYRLFNNVNKILGTANMVEEALVVGNRYRSSYPELDSDLTHAELAYRNGEYTKALKEAIVAIEKIHPDTEKAIKESAARV
ncbi:MAG: septation ring formation regulator EzrA [Erysipelotrichaceae bacterium]|nr:septation ring formation regulator EzrA [Erysipelotrichaceae bacterium]